jgi:sugar phosphate isomerase/epimerase
MGSVALAEELLLLAYDDESGRATGSQIGLDLGMAAAVLVELHHRTICASASSALRLLDGLDPAHVGVIHDAGNLLIEGQEDYRSAFELLGAYLAHVHVKNVAWRETGRRADGSAVWSAQWAPLRDGVADFGAYFGALRAHGYDGWVTLEDFSTALPLAERTRDNLASVRTLAGDNAG